MMEDSAAKGAEEGEFIVIDLQLEFYMDAREDPISAFTTYKIHKQHLSDETEELQDFMNIVLMHILHDIDDLNSDALVLSDRNHNKYVIRKQPIQSVSILAPSEATILGLINS